MQGGGNVIRVTGQDKTPGCEGALLNLVLSCPTLSSHGVFIICN